MVISIGVAGFVGATAAFTHSSDLVAYVFAIIAFVLSLGVGWIELVRSEIGVVILSCYLLGIWIWLHAR
jgi:hypothetical protein